MNFPFPGLAAFFKLLKQEETDTGIWPVSNKAE